MFGPENAQKLRRCWKDFLIKYPCETVSPKSEDKKFQIDCV